MKNYDRTLWENNKTVVDAEKLNNVEDQLLVLTDSFIVNDKRIQVVEDTLPMKANTNHTHSEYALVDHTHEDLATNESLKDYSTKAELELAKNTLESQINVLKSELNEEFKKYVDNVEIEGNQLKLYSNGKLLKTITLPETQTPAVKALCGSFLAGQAVAGQGLFPKMNFLAINPNGPTNWQDGVTPVNAENLNKIETKILDLFNKVNKLEQANGDVDAFLHIGSEPPVATTGLWINNSDEEVEDILDNQALESIKAVLNQHKSLIDELLYITDGLLDDGDFLDNNDDTNNLDGGIF